MSSLPQTARFYILFLIALAVGAVLFSALQIGIDWSLWLGVLIVTAGIALLDAMPVDLFGEKVEITFSSSVKIASILIYPVPVTIISTFVGTLIGELTQTRPPIKKAFNIAQLTISYGAGAIVFWAVFVPRSDFGEILQNLLAFLLAGSVPFLMNWILLSFIISFVSQIRLFDAMKDTVRQTGWYELIHPVLGATLAILWQFHPLSVLLTAVIFLMIKHSYQVAVQLQRQTHDALRALVQVIDVRDHHTFDHSERVSKYAQLMGEELGLSQEEIEVLAEAGLLHDLGKVGMVDDVLYKNGALNPKERKHAQEHAEVGSMLLSKCPLFEKGSVLVRYHHERYDGKGYPEGLAGEKIPLGSRIISVADAYQAMTEDRPYRPALTQEQAIAELKMGSGTQFDPRVVDVFIKILQSKRIT
jgi:type III secretory pathway component EscS